MAYIADGREALDQLEARYNLLESTYGFEKKLVYTVGLGTPGDLDHAAVCAYFSPNKGPALWILAGIHGEEPAGPIAIAQNIHLVGALGQDIPLVILPLLNPKGYASDWRYPDERRDWRIGHSVGASEHYLPDIRNQRQPRAASPRSEIAGRVTQFVLSVTSDYPPVLVIDHHEDEDFESGYIYSQGAAGVDNAVARAVIRILLASSIPVARNDRTRFDEPITDGVAAGADGQPVSDGSIDELLAAERIIVDGQVVPKPGARTCLVIETPTTTVPLAARVEAHASILRQLRFLWELSNK